MSWSGNKGMKGPPGLCPNCSSDRDIKRIFDYNYFCKRCGWTDLKNNYNLKEKTNMMGKPECKNCSMLHLTHAHTAEEVKTFTYGCEGEKFEACKRLKHMTLCGPPGCLGVIGGDEQLTEEELCKRYKQYECDKQEYMNEINRLENIIYDKVQPEKQFPILSTSKEKEYIPWTTFVDCQHRAIANHGQTLEELARRGGLSWSETLAILEDKRWRLTDTIPTEDIAKRKVLQIISKRCVKCGSTLKLGTFAYNQDTCWGCFKNEIGVMNMRTNNDLSQSPEERDRHIQILNWLVDCLAEKWGFEW